MRLVSLLGKRAEAATDDIDGCVGGYEGRMFFGKVKAWLAGLLEVSEGVGKWTKQIVGFAKRGRQDPSPEAFKESELSWVRRSPCRVE